VPTPHPFPPCAARVLWAAAVLLILTGCGGRAVPAAGPGPGSGAARAAESVAPELAALTFDSAWSRIHASYYDSTFRGLDWPAVRDELRPRAAAATTLGELRGVLGEMLARLGESHFGIIPGEAADAVDPDAAREGRERAGGSPGLELRVVEGRLTVFRVEASGPAEAAGIRTGWVVEAIDGRPLAPLLAAIQPLEGEPFRLAEARLAMRAEALLTGDEDGEAMLEVEDGTGKRSVVAVRRRPLRGEPVRVGNLPTMFAHVEHERLPAAGGCVGVVRFNLWMTPIMPRLEQAMEELKDCQGMIVDVRGNPGGVGALVMGVAGYFMDRSVPLGTMRTRQSELRFVSVPRRATSAGAPAAPFAGPVAILVDALSMSTSEIFAAGLKDTGRARLFGQTTGGQALPALMLRLPTQDVLYHAFADLRGPAGDRIEGRGVAPDELVPLRRGDLLAGTDAPLQAALRWIGSEVAR
jgi:carboxyl-terminal processing protease